jgi:hypothetical protein
VGQLVKPENLDRMVKMENLDRKDFKVFQVLWDHLEIRVPWESRDIKEILV